MNCKNCNKLFSNDELDTDGFCYDCANLDPEYSLDTTVMVKEILENTLENLSRAKKITHSKLRNDLVNEHIISKVSIKKNNDFGGN